ncbi:hypothetical protein ACFFYR_02805 [Paraburkholderia dipogonis]|uniref:hypothetical protein n=1 Tax=Paraburkholderia dipogonis TaxID=1211383 RepID=UPI0035EE01AC
MRIVLVSPSKSLLIAVPIAPQTRRVEIRQTDALASRSSATLESVIVVIGTKKQATPMPCTSRRPRSRDMNGHVRAVNVEFQNGDEREHTMNAKTRHHARRRFSRVLHVLADHRTRQKQREQTDRRKVAETRQPGG